MPLRHDSLSRLRLDPSPEHRLLPAVPKFKILHAPPFVQAPPSSATRSFSTQLRTVLYIRDQHSMQERTRAEFMLVLSRRSGQAWR